MDHSAPLKWKIPQQIIPNELRRTRARGGAPQPPPVLHQEQIIPPLSGGGEASSSSSFPPFDFNALRSTIDDIRRDNQASIEQWGYYARANYDNLVQAGIQAPYVNYPYHPPQEGPVNHWGPYDPQHPTPPCYAYWEGPIDPTQRVGTPPYDPYRPGGCDPAYDPASTSTPAPFDGGWGAQGWPYEHFNQPFHPFMDTPGFDPNNPPQPRGRGDDNQ